MASLLLIDSFIKMIVSYNDQTFGISSHYIENSQMKNLNCKEINIKMFSVDKGLVTNFSVLSNQVMFTILQSKNWTLMIQEFVAIQMKKK